MSKKNTLVFVLDDSVKNSVFCGQVLNPLLKKLDQNIYKTIYLISFEKNYLSNQIIEKYIPKVEDLIFVQKKRLSFFGKLSLYSSIYFLKKILNQFEDYDLIARGPLAGWVCKKSISSKNCKSFKVQARGLLAAEYEITYPKSNNFLKNFFHDFRKKSLGKIEKKIYSTNGFEINFCIEAVTVALKNYLIENFEANSDKIIIASEDFPDLLNHDLKEKYKAEIRKKLNITFDTFVYCYSGAVKAWQEPDLVVNFLEEELNKQKNIFLLVLTQNIDDFENFFKLNNIDSSYYRIISVNHNEIYKYLAACDAGLVFRKKDIVSWVSRPVKAMEYKSVGLKIIHNNTVHWLLEN